MPDLLWAEGAVEDQHLVRAALQDLGLKARVAFVEDGQALLDALPGSKARLIVLDLQMPRMGGLEALRRLRADTTTRDLPVVVFTSSNHPSDVAACRELGVLDYVTKPMEFGAFTHAIERIIAAGAPTTRRPRRAN